MLVAVQVSLDAKKTLHASEQERPDVAAARTAWQNQQPQLNPAHLVLLDARREPASRAQRKTIPLSCDA